VGVLAGDYSMALIVARVILAHRAISRRSAIISAERPPCIVCALRIRSSPSGVRGPVLIPSLVKPDSRKGFPDARCI
jgi:hypothetical protein